MPDPSETADSISGTKPLSTLTLEQDLAAIASLPRPEKSRLATASSRDCFNATRNFCEMWRALVSFKIRLPASPVTMKCSRCGKGHELQGEALFSRVALSLGAYYDYGANRLIATKLPKGEQLIPGLNIPGLRKFMDASLPEDTPPYVFTAKLDASEYFMSLLGSYFFTTFRRLPVMLGAAAVFNDAALASLLSLHSRHCEMEAGSLRLLVGRLIHSCLHLLQRVSSDEAAGWNKEHAFGPFSAIRLDEVSLLARRDGTMTRKYGEKHVERVFEQQLALIVQSLGLYVVQTKTGTRTIDLVCISPDTTVHASILVEAKTSTHPYGLPTKDERALREYIDDVKRSLTTLPPLRLVLVVAHAASAGLGRKLRSLESSTGVSVRFLAAQELANLREAVVGPAPLAPLLDGLLAAPAIVQKGFAAEVARDYRRRQGAHTVLVQALMPGRPVALATPSWPGDEKQHEAEARQIDAPKRLPLGEGGG